MPITVRMVLRRTNWPDIDDVVALNADAEVMRYVDNGQPMTAARVLAEEMPRLMEHNGRADQLGYWTARDPATGGFLGWFNLTPVEGRPDTVELGYRLRRRAWGQGYGVEGVLRMIEMARAAGMATVIATMMAADVAARRLMEEAGLTLNAARNGHRTVPLADPGRRDVAYSMELIVPSGVADLAVRSG